MKLISIPRFATIALVLLAAPLWKSNAAGDTTPTVEMDNVPLSDAIRNVSRQMELNYIIHPRLLSPGGSLFSDPPITVRWRNITAEAALQRLLKEHGLAIVTNSATTVARIIPADMTVEPISAGKIGVDTNGVIPILSVDDTFAKAIITIADRAHLKIAFDPETARVFESANVSRSQVTIYIRWENITARQALAALLDNYDLALIEDTKNAVGRIVLRTTTPEKAKQNK